MTLRSSRSAVRRSVGTTVISACHQYSECRQHNRLSWVQISSWERSSFSVCGCFALWLLDRRKTPIPPPIPLAAVLPDCPDPPLSNQFAILHSGPFHPTVNCITRKTVLWIDSAVFGLTIRTIIIVSVV